MKWFFALSAVTIDHHDHDWSGMIKAAVCSARKNTWLQPNFIFDGAECQLTRDLQALGVTVIYHRYSLYERMVEAGPTFPLAIASGAFLRLDIPWLEPIDEFVLYTDCDVIFRQQPSITQLRPAFFACAPQMKRGDYNDMNSGVMLMNVKGMRKELPKFSEFIVANLANLSVFDQTALQEYYRARYDQLADELNWKPYWGASAAAEIVHFHGPKPAAVRKLLADPDYQSNPVWKGLFNESRPAYMEYLHEWDMYHHHVEAYLRTLR